VKGVGGGLASQFRNTSGLQGLFYPGWIAVGRSAARAARTPKSCHLKDLDCRRQDLNLHDHG
jgi:hypothetical protein